MFPNNRKISTITWKIWKASISNIDKTIIIWLELIYNFMNVVALFPPFNLVIVGPDMSLGTFAVFPKIHYTQDNNLQVAYLSIWVLSLS